MVKQNCLIVIAFNTSLMPTADFSGLNEPFPYIVDATLLDVLN